jgi:hypothetical protein
MLKIKKIQFKNRIKENNMSLSELTHKTRDPSIRSR